MSEADKDNSPNPKASLSRRQFLQDILVGAGALVFPKLDRAIGRSSSAPQELTGINKEALIDYLGLIQSNFGIYVPRKSGEGKSPSDSEIEKAVEFQEKWFKHVITH